MKYSKFDIIKKSFRYFFLVLMIAWSVGFYNEVTYPLSNLGYDRAYIPGIAYFVVLLIAEGVKYMLFNPQFNVDSLITNGFFIISVQLVLYFIIFLILKKVGLKRFHRFLAFMSYNLVALLFTVRNFFYCPPNSVKCDDFGGNALNLQAFVVIWIFIALVLLFNSVMFILFRNDDDKFSAS